MSHVTQWNGKELKEDENKIFDMVKKKIIHEAKLNSRNQIKRKKTLGEYRDLWKCIRWLDKGGTQINGSTD